jgi:hypothetical protein
MSAAAAAAASRPSALLLPSVPMKKLKRQLDSVIVHFVRKHQAQPSRLGRPKLGLTNIGAVGMLRPSSTHANSTLVSF